MPNKVISIQKYKRTQKVNAFKSRFSNLKNKKMPFLIIIIAVIFALIIWRNYIENAATLDVQIPPSHDISYNDQDPTPFTTAQIANKFDNAEGKVTLLYIYTTWCKSCSKNMPIFNEISREFQNSNIEIISIAIDKGIGADQLKDYLSKYGDIYFEPNFLVSKAGFVDFLAKKNIRYTGRIPFTALISKNGEIITKYTGVKNKKYLRNKIIRAVFLES